MNRKLLVMMLAAGVALLAASGYKLATKTPIGGIGKWDYLTVDAAARRIYVSHSTQVQVLDADSLAVVGKVADTPGVHGIAVVPELNRGFASAGGADKVVIFDLKTLAHVADAPTGKGPDAIIYDPASKRVFAFNGDGESATAVDAATGKVAGTVPLGGGPEFAAADGKGHIFVNLEEKAAVVKFSSKDLKVEATWPLAPCGTPTGMAMDIANNRIFSGCRSKVMAVLDATSGKLITTVPIGDHTDATFYDADSKLIFNSNGDGTITVIRQNSADSYEVYDTIKTQAGSKTMAFDPKTKNLFLPAATASKPDSFELLVFRK